MRNYLLRLVFAVISVAVFSQPQIDLEKIAEGFTQPLFLTTPGDGSGRLFVVEQNGKIKILKDGVVSETPFLDVSPDGLNLTRSSGEQGLLGLAFHPDYEINGYFYIDYTRRADGASVVSRFSVSEDPDLADSANEKIILGPVSQPFVNHNGGHIAFGPDGYLYISLGDGGSAGDPENNAQDTTNLLGNILRIDVDGGDPFGIPPDNPFVGDETGEDEIFAYGLRNPWRFSFDRESTPTARIFCGDVGQGSLEEIDLIVNGGNYGWRIMEGTACYNPSEDCPTEGLILPIYEYDHTLGCSITGGYVYRGEAWPQLEGLYFYADYCRGTIWALEEDGTDEWVNHEVYDSNLNITSFGEDEQGEIYVCGHSNGVIYRIMPAPPPVTWAAY